MNNQTKRNGQEEIRARFGQKGIFGQTLFLPYSISEMLHDSPLGFHLLSLEGWIGWSNEDTFSGKLHIPSQTVWDNPNHLGLQVPITSMQIEAIEEARKESNVNLSVSLGGQALITDHSTHIDISSTPYADRIGNVIPIQSSHPMTVMIERERWLTILLYHKTVQAYTPPLEITQDIEGKYPITMTTPTNLSR